MTWDHYHDVQNVLSLLSESTDCSYVLVVIQAGTEKEEGQRFVAKSSGEFSGPGAVCAAGEALTELMAGAYEHFGIDEDDDPAA